MAALHRHRAMNDPYVTALENARQRRICLWIALPGFVAALAWLLCSL